jgi:hypothetical protein
MPSGEQRFVILAISFTLEHLKAADQAEPF